MGTRYAVTNLYDDSGKVADHYLNEEFYSFCDSWEHAMEDEKFVAIIDTELRAEEYADAPLEGLASLAPTERVRKFYLMWLRFIDERLKPWTTGGAIHFRPHWARVLIHALTIADAMGLPDEDLRCVAMAAVFHDSRRKSPYLDTGHGGRAAQYYAEACRQVTDGGKAEAPEEAAATETSAATTTTSDDRAFGSLVYDPRTMLAILWHDHDDEEGLQAAARAVAEDIAPGSEGRGYAASLPDGAQADAATILHIFKDSDGLDRVRLGEGGLDEYFLRTEQARNQVAFAQELLDASMSV